MAHYSLLFPSFSAEPSLPKLSPLSYISQSAEANFFETKSCYGVALTNFEIPILLPLPLRITEACHHAWTE